MHGHRNTYFIFIKRNFSCRPYIASIKCTQIYWLLLSLILCRHCSSQGAYRSYRMEASSDNPLELLYSKKRKKRESELKEEEKRKLPIREDKEVYHLRLLLRYF